MEAPRFAGLHLSGPNANKTAVVIASGVPILSPLTIEKVYEKIGSFGTLFSDDRLVQILSLEGPFRDVVIDCPLTVPPCVACTRSSCPGVSRCDDLSVAYMLSLSDKVKSKTGRRLRPLNPQSQRIWDVLRELQRDPDEERLEPSYSANLAPLVVRARTLQRRLSSQPEGVTLKESSVPHVLHAVAPALQLSPEIKTDYRNFERGRKTRAAILGRLQINGFWEFDEDDEVYDQLQSSVETFQALIMAWVAALQVAALTQPKPLSYLAHEGWVEVPILVSSLPREMPVFE